MNESVGWTKLFRADRLTDTHDESKVAFHISFAYLAKDCRVNHRMYLCPCSRKTAGDETVISLFTLFCSFYATFVFTAQAWMACVRIMLTSRWNESATVHSLRVRVLLHLTAAEHALRWYWVSQFLWNRFICVCLFCMTSRVCALRTRLVITVINWCAFVSCHPFVQTT
jgi:hypothetical protein